MKAADPLRLPRKPKLRASCDSCGTAKLRCNRGQPKCERCVALNLPCVYSISRKMGKPPRCPPKRSSALQEQLGRMSKGSMNDDGHNNTPGQIIAGKPSPVPRSSPNFNGTAMAPVVPEDHAGSQNAFVPFGVSEVDLYSENGEYGEQFFSDSLPEDLGDTLQAGSEHGALSQSSMATPNLEAIAVSMEMHNICAPFIDTLMSPNGASTPSDGGVNHNCSQDAYQILGQLSVLNDSKPSPVMPSGGSSISSVSSRTTADTPRLDHILNLNREAGRRLCRILTCSCAQSPHLAFLCASIVSCILARYRQAACYARSGSLSSETASAGSPFSGLTMSSSTSGSSSPWSSAAGSMVGGMSVTSHPSAAGSAIQPLRFSLGSFSIEDEQMELALIAQLVLRELKRTAALIELFDIQSCGTAVDGVVPRLNGASSLHQSLSSWLGRMQALVVEEVQALLENT